MKNKRYASLAIRLFLISVLLIAGLSYFNPNSQTVKAVSDFTDNFDSSTLSSEWKMIDPDGGATFDLSVNPGWLRITSPSGRDLLPVKFNAPRVSQSVSGDFTVETKISALTDENDEGAGILIWKDSSNYVRLERMSRTIGHPVEQQILFGGSVNGVWPCPGDTNVVLTTSINPTYLKLIKADTILTGWYSSDGASWTQVGTIPFDVSVPINIGLAAVNEYHEGDFYADFDYFKIILNQPTELLESNLEVSCKSTTSYSNFQVEVDGTLNSNGNAITEAPILISYSVNGGKSWQDLTFLNSDSNGNFSATWNPSVTGLYLIKAVYEGDDTYLSTSTVVNLAVAQHREKNVFSVSSNSTLSSLTFNSTTGILTFKVTGDEGTNGYADVYVDKSLPRMKGIGVHFDGRTFYDFSLTSYSDAWRLHLTYKHSTHDVAVILGVSKSDESLLDNWLFYVAIAAVMIIIVTITLVLRRKKSTSRSPTK